MVGVTVTFVVHGYDVHQHDVFGVRVDPGEGHPDGGEHSPVWVGGKKNIHTELKKKYWRRDVLTSLIYFRDGIWENISD